MFRSPAADRLPHRLRLFSILSLVMLAGIIAFAGLIRFRTVAMETELDVVAEMAARVPGNVVTAMLLGSEPAYDRPDADVIERPTTRWRQEALNRLQADLQKIDAFLNARADAAPAFALTQSLERAVPMLADHDRLALRVGDYGGQGFRQDLAAANRRLDRALDATAGRTELPLRNLIVARSQKDSFFAGFDPGAQAGAGQALAAFAHDVSKVPMASALKAEILNATAAYDQAFQQLCEGLIALQARGRELEILADQSTLLAEDLVAAVAGAASRVRADHAWRTNASIAAMGIILTVMLSGYIGVALRTTGRLQRREEELHMSHARMHDLARVSSDLFWDVDADGYIRDIDGPETFRAFYGARMIGQRFYDVLRDLGIKFSGDNDVAKIWRRQKAFRDIEYQVVLPISEQVFWYSLSGLPVFDRDGRFAGFRCASKDITTAKRLQIEREEFRSRLQSTLGHLPAAAFRYERADEGLRPVFVSHNAIDVVGASADEILARAGDVSFFIDERDRVKFDCDLADGIARSGLATARGRVALPGGGSRWIQALMRSTIGADGVCAIDGIWIDVTDDEAKTSRLRDVEAAMQASGDGVIIFGPDNIEIIYANTSAYRIIGAPLDKALTVDMLRDRVQMDEETATAMRVAMAGEVARGGQWTGRFAIERPDGTSAAIFVRVTGLSDGRFLHVFTDITEITHVTQLRVEAEQKLKRTQEKNALVARALDAIQERIVIVDRHGKVSYANKAVIDGLNYTSMDDVVGLSFFDDFKAKFEDAGALRQEIRAALATHGEWLGEAPLIRYDGERRIMSVQVTRLPDSGAIFAGTDVTESVRRAAEQEKLKQRLADAQRMEAVGRLAGGIAHDFNNIIGATRAFADLLVDDLPEDSAQRTYAERIVSASRRAADLVKEIMTFSRAAHAERRPIRIADIFAEGIDILEARRPAHISLDFQNSAAGAVVNANASQIIQVLVNLVVNAVDALDEDSGSITVKAERATGDIGPPGYIEERTDGDALLLRHGQGQLETGHDYIRLTVEDTGRGMNRMTVQRIFEPFFTTKGADRGTGLGIPVVASIVAAHGGALRLATCWGRGARFEIYLPVTTVMPATTDQKTTEKRLRGHERILIVDDEVDLADALSIGLSRFNYETAPIYDPTDALRELEELPDAWDVLISDQVMPQMKGLQLVRRARAICPRLKIILCSGHSDSASEQSARDVGADIFLHKPVTAEDLARVVRGLIDG